MTFKKIAQSFLYFDSRNNLEIYSNTTDGLAAVRKWINDTGEGHEITAEINTLLATFKSLKELETRRQCFYDLETLPTTQMLNTLVNMPAIQNCNDLATKLKQSDIYNDVRVEYYNPAKLNFDTFERWKPAIPSAFWMAWASDGNVFYYKDSDDNLEIYSTKDMSAQRESNAVIVRIPSNAMLNDRLLPVARARLYQSTNELHATQKQLDDTVKLIGQNPIGNSNLKEWGDKLFPSSVSQSQNDAVWTYATPAGKPPLPPKFYFNPKPLGKVSSGISILQGWFEGLKV